MLHPLATTAGEVDLCTSVHLDDPNSHKRRSSLILENNEDIEKAKAAAAAQKSGKGAKGKDASSKSGRSGLCVYSATTKKSYLSKCAHEDPRYNDVVDHHLGYRPQSVLTCPILPTSVEAGGPAVLGVVQVVSNKRTLGDSELRLLEKMCSCAARAMLNATTHAMIAGAERTARAMLHTSRAITSALRPPAQGTTIATLPRLRLLLFHPPPTSSPGEPSLAGIGAIGQGRLPISQLEAALSTIGTREYRLFVRSHHNKLVLAAGSAAIGTSLDIDDIDDPAAPEVPAVVPIHSYS